MFTWNKEDPLIRDQTVSRLFLVNDKNKEAERIAVAILVHLWLTLGFFQQMWLTLV